MLSDSDGTNLDYGRSEDDGTECGDDSRGGGLSWLLCVECQKHRGYGCECTMHVKGEGKGEREGSRAYIFRRSLVAIVALAAAIAPSVVKVGPIEYGICQTGEALILLLPH